MSAERTCQQCGVRLQQESGNVLDSRLPDPCLGELPGVLFACCGHGLGDGYIIFRNGVIIRWQGAIEVEQTPDLATSRHVAMLEYALRYGLVPAKENQSE